MDRTLTGIARRGRGKAGAWYITREVTPSSADITMCHLWHYGTCMLTWRADNPSDENYLDYSLGWGSKSDQQGMNKVFRELCIPLYYSRKGGAEIVSTRRA